MILKGTAGLRGCGLFQFQFLRFSYKFVAFNRRDNIIPSLLLQEALNRKASSELSSKPFSREKCIGGHDTIARQFSVLEITIMDINPYSMYMTI